MLATRTNKIESVKKLLELGANPNAHDDSTKYFGQQYSKTVIMILIKYMAR